MDGITFLKKIMSTHPTPVIICSTLTEKGATATMEAMSSGAVDIITKPKVDLKNFLLDSRDRMLQSIRGAARARMANVRASLASAPKKLDASEILPESTKTLDLTTDQVVAIGSSTGGTIALEKVLTRLPRTAPGIVIVLHMPEHFTSAFAERLDSLCQVKVKEAEDHDRIVPGVVLIANGGKHLLVKRSGAQYRVELKDGPPVSRHKPSVDVLFHSVANVAGKNALGIILTGMGDDGAKGLKEMLDNGAHTIAQDEKSCVVFGMPREAIRLGAAKQIVSLDDVAMAIMASSR
jgi:two-component system chemotaxis response regulator CheB